MPYVALRPLKLPVLNKEGQQCGVKVINPGQVVPGVEKWTYPNIIAHLNLDWIKWRGEPMKAPHLAHKGARVVDIRAYRGDGNPRLMPEKKDTSRDERVGGAGPLASVHAAGARLHSSKKPTAKRTKKAAAPRAG